jgi:hypothetical protein
MIWKAMITRRFTGFRALVRNGRFRGQDSRDNLRLRERCSQPDDGRAR